MAARTRAVLVDKMTLPANIRGDQFRELLGRYPNMVESMSKANPPKPGQKSLVQLDKFRYDEATRLFSSARPKRAMEHEDVKTLVEWKLRHGKFRPTLMKLVSSNDATSVRATMEQAMKGYWEKPDLPKALERITQLKGVGPATASLLLSVCDPARVIFFSDEAFHWLCCDGGTPAIKYNAKEYRELNAAAEALVKRLGVSATDVEKVAYVIQKQGSDLPVPGEAHEQAPDSTELAEAGPVKGSKKRKGRAEVGEDEEETPTLGVRRSRRVRAAR